MNCQSMTSHCTCLFIYSYIHSTHIEQLLGSRIQRRKRYSVGHQGAHIRGRAGDRLGNDASMALRAMLEVCVHMDTYEFFISSVASVT